MLAHHFLFLIFVVLTQISEPFNNFYSQTTSISKCHYLPLFLSKLGSKVQSLDYTTLDVLLPQIKNLLIPGKVENIVQDDVFNTYLEIKTNKPFSEWIHICWHPDFAHIGLKSPTLKAEPLPYSFAAISRSILKGLNIMNISIMSSLDRIAVIEFGDNSSNQPKYKLILEIMGARSNIVLISGGDNIIRACGYQVSSSSSIRPLQTSGKYSLPPPGGGIFDPIQHFSILSSSNSSQKDLISTFLDHLNFVGVTTKGLDRILVKCYKGLSPNIAKLLIQIALPESDNNRTINEISPDQTNELFFAFQAWVEVISSHSVVPSSTQFEQQDITKKYSFTTNPAFLNDGVTYVPISPSPLISSGELENINPVYFIVRPLNCTIVEFMKYYYYEKQKINNFELKKYSCSKKLTALHSKTDKLMSDFTTQLSNAREGKADSLRNMGDMITSFLYSWDGGQALQCQDFETGADITIDLPQGVSPATHSQSLYKQSKKLKKSIDVVETLLKKVEYFLAYLDEIETSISNIESFQSDNDISTLHEIEKELDDISSKSILYYFQSSDDVLNNKLGQGDFDNWGNLIKGKMSGNIKASTKTASGKSKQSKSNGNNGRNPNSKLPAKISGGPVKVSSKKKLYQGLLILDHSDSSNNPGNAEKKTDIDSTSRTSVPYFPRLIVGRNSKQNEKISFEIAQDHHLWFHVQGCPGSHCLLQLNNGETASEEALQFAADVTAYHSKARGSTQAPVVYCSPKYIKKISGGPPGMVSILKSNGILYGRPDRGRLLTESLSTTKS